jgi:hypothetical protein
MISPSCCQPWPRDQGRPAHHGDPIARDSYTTSWDTTRLEFCLYLEARYFGGRPHRSKACRILDRQPCRYQKFISDIAGQDNATHGDDAGEVIKAVRDFLNSHNGP